MRDSTEIERILSTYDGFDLLKIWTAKFSCGSWLCEETGSWGSSRRHRNKQQGHRPAGVESSSCAVANSRSHEAMNSHTRERAIRYKYSYTAHGSDLAKPGDVVREKVDDDRKSPQSRSSHHEVEVGPPFPSKGRTGVLLTLVFVFPCHRRHGGVALVFKQGSSRKQ